MFMFLCSQNAHTFPRLFISLYFLEFCAPFNASIGSLMWCVVNACCQPTAIQCSQPQPNIVKRDLCVGVVSENAIWCEKRKKTRRRQSAAEAATAAATAKTTYSKQICFAGNYDNSCLVRFPSLPFCCFLHRRRRCRRGRRVSQCIFQRIISERVHFVAIYSFLVNDRRARASVRAMYKNQRDEIDWIWYYFMIYAGTWLCCSLCAHTTRSDCIAVRIWFGLAAMANDTDWLHSALARLYEFIHWLILQTHHIHTWDRWSRIADTRCNGHVTRHDTFGFHDSIPLSVSVRWRRATNRTLICNNISIVILKLVATSDGCEWMRIKRHKIVFKFLFFFFAELWMVRFGSVRLDWSGRCEPLQAPLILLFAKFTACFCRDRRAYLIIDLSIESSIRCVHAVAQRTAPPLMGKLILITTVKYIFVESVSGVVSNAVRSRPIPIRVPLRSFVESKIEFITILILFRFFCVIDSIGFRLFLSWCLRVSCSSGETRINIYINIRISLFLFKSQIVVSCETIQHVTHDASTRLNRERSSSSWLKNSEMSNALFFFLSLESDIN